MLFWFLKGWENLTRWANFAFWCFSSGQNSVYEWRKKFRFLGLIPLLILALTKRGLVFLFDYLLFKLVWVERNFAQIFFGFWFWTLIEACVLHLFPFWVEVWFAVCWLSSIFLTTWTQLFGLFKYSVVFYFWCSVLNSVFVFPGKLI